MLNLEIEKEYTVEEPALQYRGYAEVVHLKRMLYRINITKEDRFYFYGNMCNSEYRISKKNQKFSKKDSKVKYPFKLRLDLILGVNLFYE